MTIPKKRKKKSAWAKAGTGHGKLPMKKKKPAPTRIKLEPYQKAAIVHEFEVWATKQWGEFEKEAELIEGRRFKSDYWFPKAKVTVEINGGQWNGGRHTSCTVSGKNGQTDYERDLEKGNLIQSQGIAFFQFTYEMLYRKEYERCR